MTPLDGSMLSLDIHPLGGREMNRELLKKNDRNQVVWSVWGSVALIL